MHSTMIVLGLLTNFIIIVIRTGIRESIIHLLFPHFSGELHLTPLSAMVQMRPNFDYLDKADTRHRAEAANTSLGDGGKGIFHLLIMYYWAVSCNFKYFDKPSKHGKKALCKKPWEGHQKVNIFLCLI